MPQSVGVVLVTLFAAISCQGIQQRVDVLRAKKIEIIGEDERTKIDLEAEVLKLRARVTALEARLDASGAPSPTP